MMSSVFDRARVALRRLIADRGGFSAVLTALMLTILIGFVGLGIDVGAWQWTQRQMQEAADHAAFAAAQVSAASGVANTPCSTVAAPCETGLAVAVNGLGLAGSNFTLCTPNAAQNNVTICINNPPASGDYAGNIYAWEATISQTRPMWFSRVLFSGSGTITARAVAWQTALADVGTPCVIALNTSGADGLLVSGSASTMLANCDAIVKSNDALALRTTGTTTFSAQNVFVDGDESLGGSSFAPAFGTTGNHRNMDDQTLSVFQDPYSGRTAPAFAGCDYAGGSLTQGPGVYCGAVTINGGATLASGLYVLDRASLTITNTGTLHSDGTCDGNGVNATAVSIYLTSSTGSGIGQVSINGCLSIAAPRQGIPMINWRLLPHGHITNINSVQVQGIALWVDHNADSGVTDQLGTGSNLSITGALYDPARLFEVSGNAQSTCGQIVANQVAIDNAANVNLQFNCSGVGVSFPSYRDFGPIKLVE